MRCVPQHIALLNPRLSPGVCSPGKPTGDGRASRGPESERRLAHWLQGER